LTLLAGYSSIVLLEICLLPQKNTEAVPQTYNPGSEPAYNLYFFG